MQRPMIQFNKKEREKLIPILMNLFGHRNNAYALRQGNNGYKAIRSNINGELIDQHLTGSKTIGTYFINNYESNTVKAICWDIEPVKTNDPPYGRNPNNTFEDAIKFVDHLMNKYGILAFLEASGSEGHYHVWIFIQETNANIARQFGIQISKEVGIYIPEINPKQDRLVKPDSLGNLVKLPFGINTKVQDKNKNGSFFINTEYKEPYKNKDIIFTLGLINEGNKTNINDHIKKPKKDIVITSNKDYEDDGQELHGDTHGLAINRPEPTESLIESMNLLVCKLKHCEELVYHKKIQLNGSEGHDFRVHACRDMVLKKFNDEEIHQYFKVQKDYNYGTTQKFIQTARDEISKEYEYEKRNGIEYKPKHARCEVMRKKSGSIVKPICNLSCRLRKDVTRATRRGENIGQVLEKYEILYFKLVWDQIKKYPVNNGFIDISGEELRDIISNLNVNYTFESMIDTLKKYDLITLSKDGHYSIAVKNDGKVSRKIRIDKHGFSPA
jgi:hypothetical protein